MKAALYRKQLCREKVTIPYFLFCLWIIAISTIILDGKHMLIYKKIVIHNGLYSHSKCLKTDLCGFHLLIKLNSRFNKKKDRKLYLWVLSFLHRKKGIYSKIFWKAKLQPKRALFANRWYSAWIMQILQDR